LHNAERCVDVNTHIAGFENDLIGGVGGCIYTEDIHKMTIGGGEGSCGGLSVDGDEAIDQTTELVKDVDDRRNMLVDIVSREVVIKLVNTEVGGDTVGDVIIKITWARASGEGLEERDEWSGDLGVSDVELIFEVFEEEVLIVVDLVTCFLSLEDMIVNQNTEVELCNVWMPVRIGVSETLGVGHLCVTHSYDLEKYCAVRYSVILDTKFGISGHGKVTNGSEHLGKAGRAVARGNDVALRSIVLFARRASRFDVCGWCIRWCGRGGLRALSGSSFCSGSGGRASGSGSCRHGKYN
jgi:hypothetical protein